MKKILIAAVSVLVAQSGYAQKTMHGFESHPVQSAGVVAKTSGVGSTLTLSNIASADTVRTLYSHTGTGSGYVNGTNSFNDMGFAERFTFNGNDSSMKVLGICAQFGGKVNPASTKNVTLLIWGQGPAQAITSTLFYNGFPSSSIDGVDVPVTNLGIGPVKDTIKTFMFATPTAALSGPFFAGYTIDYAYNTLNGDTIALAASTNGHRNPADYSLNYVRNADGDTVATQTILNVQNATQWSDGNWYDNYTQNDSIANNLAVYPIVYIGSPTEAGSISRNNLTFFGSYPNPAVSNINIQYALSAPASVTIDIVGLNGAIVKSQQEDIQATGKHIATISTSGLAAGDYLYIIHTSNGDGLASKLTVIK